MPVLSSAEACPERLPQAGSRRGPRAFNRRQRADNAAFLAALARTGNARLAARELGVHRSTYTKRRARHPAFAAQWESALAAAQALLERGGGPPKAVEGLVGKRTEALRTRGGEPAITRLRSGRVQLRLARPGRITPAAEQAFFRALSASANIRLSAAAAGFAHSSFYARARKSRAFAREMRLALAMGYERVEAAALMAALPESHADDGWRHNDPPPIPAMTPDQALQLLFLHEKSVRQSWDQPHRRKRRGEPWETYTERLRAMWTAEQARAAEDQAVRAAAREQRDERAAIVSSKRSRRRPTGGSSDPDEPVRRHGAALPRPSFEDEVPTLPSLDQVTGWSKADPNKAPHNPGRALFGGWRIGDWKKTKRG